jgi:hypothetical protein
MTTDSLDERVSRIGLIHIVVDRHSVSGIRRSGNNAPLIASSHVIGPLPAQTRAFFAEAADVDREVARHRTSAEQLDGGGPPACLATCLEFLSKPSMPAPLR